MMMMMMIVIYLTKVLVYLMSGQANKTREIKKWGYDISSKEHFLNPLTFSRRQTMAYKTSSWSTVVKHPIPNPEVEGSNLVIEIENGLKSSS